MYPINLANVTPDSQSCIIHISDTEVVILYNSAWFVAINAELCENSREIQINRQFPDIDITMLGIVSTDIHIVTRKSVRAIFWLNRHVFLCLSLLPF